MDICRTKKTDLINLLGSGMASSGMHSVRVNQSDSKILETPLTQEKFEILNSFFTYGCTSVGATD